MGKGKYSLINIIHLNDFLLKQLLKQVDTTLSYLRNKMLLYLSIAVFILEQDKKSETYFQTTHQAY